jgi:drug/metabolite transporter (DMT)-like permease
LEKNRTRAIIFLVIAGVLWSTGGVLIKYIDWNPFAIAGMRSGISAIVMMMYLRQKIVFKPYKIVGGFFYCAMMVLFVVATKMTTAANAILLQYTAPIWVAIFAGWILKEKISKIDWIAIFGVFGGMALFFMDKLGAGQMLGNTLAILAGVTLAGATITLKLATDAPAVEVPLIGNVMTFLVCLPFVFSVTFTTQNIIAILALGIFQLGISYILFTSGIKYLSAIEAILIAVIEPLLNPVWVFIFTGEMPGAMAILGGAIVVGAVTMRQIKTAK